MGDDVSNADYVSFLVFWLSQSSFGFVFWCDFGICFGICLMMLVYVHMYMDVNNSISYVI